MRNSIIVINYYTLNVAVSTAITHYIIVIVIVVVVVTHCCTLLCAFLVPKICNYIILLHWEYNNYCIVVNMLLKDLNKNAESISV